MMLKTLSPENQFKIICPIFKAETKIAACFVLRDLVWRGERPQIRMGCQCAMDAGKCPIPVVLSQMVREPNIDPYHSTEPKVGKLDDWVLDKIAPVLVPERTMSRVGVSASEEKALMAANEDARSEKHVSTKALRKPDRFLEDVAPIAPPAAAAKTISAAASGDMSSALDTEKETA